MVFIYSSDGRMVRTSGSGNVDLCLILSWVKPMTVKLVLAASLLDAEHYRDMLSNETVWGIEMCLTVTFE